MPTPRALNSAAALARRLRHLHAKRRQSWSQNGGIREPRKALTPSQRREILVKTGGRCHICGGKIKRGARWAADHILAHAHGGRHDVANYLPAHGECNKIRWHFQPEEFRWILKLGIWFRTRIAREVPLALQLAERFVAHERKRFERGSEVVIEEELHRVKLAVRSSAGAPAPPQRRGRP